MEASIDDVPTPARPYMLRPGVYDLVACETYLASRRIRLHLDDGRGGTTPLSSWPPRPAVGSLHRHPQIAIIRIDVDGHVAEDTAGIGTHYYALIPRPWEGAWPHPKSRTHVRIDADLPVTVEGTIILIGDARLDVVA